jgi:hypothetical protein
MHGAVKQRLSAEADRLIAAGDALLRTEFRRSRPGYIDMGDPYVDLEAFHKWRTGCQNFARRFGDRAKVWADAFSGSGPNYLVVATSLLGALRSLKEAIDSDMLSSVETLVFAEAFDDLLEQSAELLEKGYYIASGVLCRAVLESHLRKLCDHNGCASSGRATIEPLKQALVKAGHLDKIAARAVEMMSTAGNHCAHAEQPPLTDADVRKLIDDVRHFLLRHPLP